ncbi:translation initiation factor IF-2 [Alphaproteobacteria bacterium]|nr:translation initiation factor IF-2 [Alphaproteobacteria bacterium]
MTDDKTNNNTRSKLTLKLPSSVSAPEIGIKNPNNNKDKKTTSSAVHVTIKGRKKDNFKKDDLINGLNRQEIEARFKAISSNSNSSNEDLKTNDILNKIREVNKNDIFENNEKTSINQEKPNSSNLKNSSKTNSKYPSKNTEESTKNNEDIIISQQITFEKSPDNLVKDLTSNEQKTDNITNYNLDDFDVRNKIKQSVALSNQQKEQREKMLLERKKNEEEKIAKEKNIREQLEKDRKKNKTKNSPTKSGFIEDDNSVRQKFIKEEKFNVRRLTYIIDSDSEDDFESGTSRRRKPKFKNKNDLEQNQTKDYKKIARDVIIPDLITVSELSERMTEKAGDVVKKLFAMGMVVTSNQAIDADTAEIIVSEFGHNPKRVSKSDVENTLQDNFDHSDERFRAPVVTIMGHVDHGKTSLLDALRQTNVVDNEHGGITQHIGASRIKTKDGKFITFLDTPGHEAFTEMRSRGANITDIVVLVVAADDGVKEQTIEAINHAKAANVPIIVAVNKIDKPGCNPKIVKNELLTHHIVAEELGGDVMFVEVSAKAKINLDKLEEAILLQAEILDLKAPYLGKSVGAVIESRIDPNKGVIATVLVQKGTLDIGDLIVAGTSYGKIRKMTDDTGKNIAHATPSVPVEILGLDNAPNAGDKFVEVNEERQAREIISYRSRKEKEDKALKNSAKSLSDIFKESGKGKLKYLNLIIKGDVHGSVEAIIGSVTKLSNNEVAIKVIHSATGGISESDISLAVASNAVVIGFNVRANSSAKNSADNKKIEIRYYSIIYNLVDDLKLLLSGMLTPIKNEEYLGQAEIRQVFKVSGAGKIAGSFVTDGIIKRNSRVRILRDSIVIHDGTLKTLKRFKEDVKEVKSGFECGIALENFDDIKDKDIIECYEIVEQKRTI